MKKLLTAAFLLVNIAMFGQGLQSAGYVTGSGSAAAISVAFCTLNLNNQSTVTLSVTGTFSAAFQGQISVDNGVTYVTIATSTSVLNLSSNAFQSSGNIGSAGVYTMSVAGATNFRCFTSSYTSGTIVVSAKAVNNASSIFISGSAGVSILSGSAGVAIPTFSIDLSNAAITANNTTGPYILLGGSSFEINVQVTAITAGGGYAIDIQESDDAGNSNWFTVYSMPLMTAIGNYRSPKLPVTGNRMRYVQTVTGTTPTITRTLNKNMSNDAVNSTARQLIDRSTIVLTTAGSTTPILDVSNSNNVQLVVSIGAATTAPALQLQASYDYGVTWSNVGTVLTAVASSTVQYTLPAFNAALLRAIVTTAGATVTPNFVEVRAF